MLGKQSPEGSFWCASLERFCTLMPMIFDLKIGRLEEKIRGHFRRERQQLRGAKRETQFLIQPYRVKGLEGMRFIF